ncbi:hypothetical protein [Adhaeribacter aquaticus]|uniref:hypothetical protein n=1 Tax=Adhaeribacter aquaticus TaxID=299567 RepID=UPI00047A130A|nr:hypothetical protein [Adhaeribacter aquaticus]
MPLEIRKSKIRNGINVLFSISALAFYFFLVFSEENNPNTFITSVPGLVLILLTTLFIRDFLDTTPIYILTEEGLHNKAKDFFVAWKDIQDFKLYFIQERYVGIQVLQLQDIKKQTVSTLVLTGTDFNEQNLQDYINKNIQK